MAKKIRFLLAAAIAAFGIFGTAFVTMPATAMSPVPQPGFVADFKSDACNGLNDIGSGGCGKKSNSTISHLMTVLLNLLSLLAGFIAVVMIIISGIRFMTANGDASGIASARTALIYALVGIVVVAMSQAIVHFVLVKFGV
jgi:Type IV secretion system pilin